MIDYYLHKKCPLVMPAGRQTENVRCGGCVWLDRGVGKCVFSLNYPKEVTAKDVVMRIRSVNGEQQAMLSEPFQRFVLRNEEKNVKTKK
jgi:hypothetical protein